MRFALAVLFLSGAALAQTPQFYGNWLSKPGYVTQATATYFVDPTGNDNGACTSSGTGACLTPDGVMAKLPFNIAHAITVNVAAGTYAVTMNVSNFNFVGGSITFTGPSTTNATVATGSATGSLTSVSNTAAPATVLTDSGQTWTVDNLRGMYLEMTSGAANGVRRVIMANTATTVTLAQSFSVAPSAADTYAIRVPAANMQALVMSRNNVSGNQAAVVTISGIDYSRAGIACNINGFNGRVDLTTVRCRSTSSAVGLIMTAIGTSSLTNVYGTSTTGSAATFTRAALGVVTGGFPYFASAVTTGTSGAVLFSTGSITAGGISAENTSSSGNAFAVSSGSALGTASTSGNQFSARCASGSSGSGIFVSGGTANLDNVTTVNCSNGYLVSGTSSTVNISTAAVLNTHTIGFNINAGGKVNINSAFTPTFTTVTNEAQVESENTAVLVGGFTGFGFVNPTTGGGFFRGN